MFQPYLLTRGRSKIVISSKHFAFDFGVMGGVLRLSSSATFQMLITMTSYIGVIVFWVLQMPLAWGLSVHTSLGPAGVFVTLGVCFSIFAAVGAVLFRRGGWKLTKV